jgi:subtilisin family serine protease
VSLGRRIPHVLKCVHHVASRRGQIGKDFTVKTHADRRWKVASAAIAITTLAVASPAFVGTTPDAVLSNDSAPTEVSRAYIVEGSTSETAGAEVSNQGGDVTGTLPLIDSVSATLTRAQAANLRKSRGVRGVFPDASVKVASAAVDQSTTSTVADHFDAISYANNDGSHRWASDWIESGDDGQPLSGKIGVSLNLLPGLVSSGRLTLTGNGPSISRRAAIAPGARHATLRFNAWRSGLEANDYVSVQASRDGFSWTEVGRLAGPANDTQPAKVAFDVSRFVSSDTAIRFVTRMSSSLLDRDVVQVDDVELGYDSVYATGVSYPSLASADKLHAQGITGLLVTVAVLDTGYWHHPDTDTNSLGLGRVLAQYDAINDRMDAQQLSVLGITSLGTTANTDESGHGSHVTGIILDNQRTQDGKFFGVAPDANLVSIRAFDAQGRGSYSSVIRGIEWAVQNRGVYRIRVLNLSLGAAPQSRYWDDPLNRAAMKAWQAGIVVVTSAGNTGPAPQTITVPGNDRQLHARRRHGRQTRVVFRRGPDARGFRKARRRRARRSHLVAHADVRKHRADASGVSEQRRLLHDVWHVAGGRCDERGRRAAAAGAARPDARSGEVQTDVIGAPGCRLEWCPRLQHLSARRRTHRCCRRACVKQSGLRQSRPRYRGRPRGFAALRRSGEAEPERRLLCCRLERLLVEPGLLLESGL